MTSDLFSMLFIVFIFFGVTSIFAAILIIVACFVRIPWVAVMISVGVLIVVGLLGLLGSIAALFTIGGANINKELLILFLVSATYLGLAIGGVLRQRSLHAAAADRYKSSH